MKARKCIYIKYNNQLLEVDCFCFSKPVSAFLNIQTVDFELIKISWNNLDVTKLFTSSDQVCNQIQEICIQQILKEHALRNKQA